MSSPALPLADRPPESPDDVLVLTLPDGATREVAPGTLPRDVVASIGERLLRAAVAVSVDGEVQDLMTPLRRGGAFRVLTERDPEALAVLRHSGAHALATAVRRLRPDAKIGFGPAIDDGFYYDFEVAEPFTPEDLAAFEAEMRRVAQEKLAFERREVSRDEARAVFRDDPLKLERVADLPEGEVISTYRDGDFVDLCRGPHVPDTGWLKHFKLLHTAGAYWRGDSRRQMLQRIYATAYFKKDELEQDLHRREEARRRDHRVLGRQLDLFHFFPQSPGAVFWTPRGTALYNTLVDFVRGRQAADFHEVRTPLIYTKMLWEQSGHWGKYKENMFLILDNESGEHDMSLKPMNCPSHYLYYNAAKHSYRELPLRYTTMDVLHRNEVSGALSGLTRVRQFSQDDCHVFLAEEQIAAEVRFLLEFILGHYRTFGLAATVKFATRPEQRLGDDSLWDRAESGLKAALESLGLEYELAPGDGAFYGPKIDFAVSDSIGRRWQLGTMQLDYLAPERFDLTYVGEDNAPHRPVVLHRAIFGSFERFTAILIEHFAGAFPAWLAPVQATLVTVADRQFDYARKVRDSLRAKGYRVEFDERGITLNAKIREAQLQKVPFTLVVGDNEVEAGGVAPRRYGGEDLKSMKLEDFEALLAKEAALP